MLQQARARSQPRVCSDMMSRVARRAAAYNNAAGVADSWPRTAAKLGYYQALKLAYGFAGRCTQARPAPFLGGGIVYIRYGMTGHCIIERTNEWCCMNI